MKHPKKTGKKVGASLLPLLTAMATIAPTSEKCSPIFGQVA